MNIRGYGLSKVNGPGNRFVLWTQGCSKGCLECFNPETWSNNIFKELSPKQIFELVKNFEVDGVTISGGDPLEQEVELLELLFFLKGKMAFHLLIDVVLKKVSLFSVTYL